MTKLGGKLFLMSFSDQEPAGWDRQAEAAVIAWMRHRTTAYDTMKIAWIKGKRREVR